MTHISFVGGEWSVVEIQRIIKMDNKHIVYYLLFADSASQLDGK
jgi:hypothetical protein